MSELREGTKCNLREIFADLRKLKDPSSVACAVVSESMPLDLAAMTKYRQKCLTWEELTIGLCMNDPGFNVIKRLRNDIVKAIRNIFVGDSGLVDGELLLFFSCFKPGHHADMPTDPLLQNDLIAFLAHRDDKRKGGQLLRCAHNQLLSTFLLMQL